MRLAAYIAVQNLSLPQIPFDVFQEIKRSALSAYPDDYEMEEYKIRQQVEAYERVTNYASSTAVAASSAVEAPLAATTTPAEPQKTITEPAFIQAVRDGRAAYRAAPNDLAKGGARARRKAAICAALKGDSTVQGWVGRIKTLSSNSDGKGVLSIEIADGVAIKTWNNALSDITDQTLIDPTSSLFAALAVLKEGDLVVLAGRFIPSDVDCVRESSMTLGGSMDSPDFIFRFSSVAKQ